MFLQALLFSVPEALAVSWLVYSLSGGSINWSRFLIIGALTGIFSVLYRPYLNSYVLNVLLYACTLILLFNLFKIVSLWESVTAVSLAIPIYTLIEFLNLTIISSLLHLEPVEIMEDLFLKLSCFSSQLVFTVILAFILSRYKVGLFSKDMED